MMKSSIIVVASKNGRKYGYAFKEKIPFEQLFYNVCEKFKNCDSFEILKYTIN